MTAEFSINLDGACEAAKAHAANAVTQFAPTPDPYATLGTVVDLAVAAEPLAYLVEGLPFAPGGKTNALAGPPKGGKSPFALLLAICVALGISFLGRRVLRPGPVLYLDAETGRLAHVRYRRLCRALGVDPAAAPLTFRNVEARFDAKYLQTLQACVEADQYRLVVIDTYGAMLEGGIDYNTPDFAFYLKELGMLSRRLDVVILVLIHEKKSGGRPGASGLEQISGSFAAAGAMQGVVSLRPEGEANDAPIVVSCSRAPEDDFRPFRMRWRDVSAPEAASPGVRLATDGNRWGLVAEIVDGEPAPVRSAAKGAQDEEAIRYLCQHLGAGPSTLRGIRDAVTTGFATQRRAGVGKDRLASLVELLIDQGTVVTSVQSTSKADVTYYGLRKTSADVG